MHGPMVTLYKHGVSIPIPADAVERFVSDGWLRESPDDLPRLLQEIEQFSKELPSAAKRYVESVQKDGVIDTADDAEMAVAERCFSELRQRFIALHTVVHAVYPIV